MRLVAVVAFAATQGSLALARHAAAASVCKDTGEVAPDGVTVMASKAEPATDAWIISPNCNVETITVDASGLFAMNNKDVRYVISVPANALSIESYGNSHVQANFSAARNATSLSIQKVNVDRLDLVFPASLTSLVLDVTTLRSIDNFEFPAGFTDLAISYSEIPTLTTVKLPRELKKLNVSRSKIAAVDFQFPPTLERFVLNYNTIVKFENFTLPNTLKAFSCELCGTTTVRGIRWSSSLVNLSLIGNPITDFEIRESDLKTIQRPGTLAVDAFSQPPCADATATRVSVGGNNLCVITDARFESRYGNGSSTDSSETTTPPRTASEPIISPSTAPGKAADSTSNGVLLLGVAVVGGLLVLTAGVGGFMVHARKKKRQRDRSEHGAAQSSSTAQDGDSKDANAQSDAGLLELTAGFRDDAVIAALRIEQHDLMIRHLIEGGDSDVVYRGSYRGRDVAIKQLPPNAWRDAKKLAGFIDEIRLSVRLDHPKIVTFVGVAWSSLRDLSAVIEYMAGGDLHTVIHEYPASTGAEWFEPWTPRRLQSKSDMAVDVAEAVVYLHSFSNPIIHRDLKTKNVLLDKGGNAKLSDFGISREVPIDETMTSEIGTVAWIAPEVLRGERYSEKADIYSLGVLLVELDRCCHPYAHVGDSVSRCRSATGSRHPKNVKIARLVSVDQLQPSVSSQCPSPIAALIGRCLQYDPEERPTAMEVFYQLRQLRKYSL